MCVSIVCVCVHDLSVPIFYVCPHDLCVSMIDGCVHVLFVCSSSAYVCVHGLLMRQSFV